MAKGNKFKSNPQADQRRSASYTNIVAPPVQKPTNAPLEESRGVTRPREPEDDGSDLPRTRPRTSSKTWDDGDKPGQFALTSGPASRSQTYNNPSVTISLNDTFLPKHVEVKSRYDIHCLEVGAGSKIRAKVTTLLQLLENGFDLRRTDQKPSIVAVTGRQAAINKSVSVVEIAKRELEHRRFRWFQYSSFGSITVEHKPRAKIQNNANLETVGKGRRVGGKETDSQVAADVEMEYANEDAVEGARDQQDEEAEVFQTMSLPHRQLLRDKAWVRIYLSRVPVPALREEFGEQSYDPARVKT